MAVGWASQESSPDREVVRSVVAHVPYPEKFEVTTVHPEDFITSQAKDSDLSDLCPSIQVPKPASLSKFPDQANKTKLCK